MRRVPKECSDHRKRDDACKHVMACWILERAYRPSLEMGKCYGCSGSLPRRYMIEVTEDHESLTWFEGDMLCEQCAQNTGVL